MTARIALNGEAFRKLVSGEPVRDTGANGRIVVEVILSDIGFAVMRAAIDDAELRMLLQKRLLEPIGPSDNGL
jgi:hypothetical protein